MSQSYLDELIQIAVRIMELDQLESQLTGTPDWKDAKEEYDALQAHFNKVRDEYVDVLLEREESRASVIDDVVQPLSEFRERADPSWYPAIEYTRDNLVPHLTREAAKSPRLRKVLKVIPLVVAGLVLVAYFGIRILSGTPVTDDIESRAGLEQRAAAAEKVIRYDDWMSTRVRRGGWVKGILLWPIEPTDNEIQGASEFVGLVLESQQYAEGCGGVLGYGDDLTEEQIGMVRSVAEYVQHVDTRWEEPPVLTLVVGLQHAESC